MRLPTRTLSLSRIPGLRRLPQALNRRQPGLIVFDSWGGQYSDNPRAIFEELRSRDAPYHMVWVLSDDAAERPDDAVTVHPRSRRHLEYMGRATYVVCNTNMPHFYWKKRGTTYVQTWHGTPLKRIAFDIEQPVFAGSKRYLRRVRRDIASWDFLISPNRFSSEVFREAFGYEGSILETGYPRNDVLTSRDRHSIRDRVRRELGIPGEAQAILYAPTFRDDERSFNTALSIQELEEALPEAFLLLRAHKLVADTVSLPAGSRTLNVSHHADIRELYLAADVLITDYSSVMFDFAVTRKPMLFYAYDLEKYRDELRGFYFDFKADAPGPLLRTTAEVIDALRDVDRVRAGATGRYDRFVERYCALEDGHAAARVVDSIFAAAHDPSGDA